MDGSRDVTRQGCVRGDVPRAAYLLVDAERRALRRHRSAVHGSIPGRAGPSGGIGPRESVERSGDGYAEATDRLTRRLNAPFGRVALQSLSMRDEHDIAVLEFSLGGVEEFGDRRGAEFAVVREVAISEVEVVAEE